MPLKPEFVGELLSLDGGRIQFFVEDGEVRVSLASDDVRVLRLSGSDADVFATLLHVAVRRLSGAGVGDPREARSARSEGSNAARHPHPLVATATLPARTHPPSNQPSAARGEGTPSNVPACPLCQSTNVVPDGRGRGWFCCAKSDEHGGASSWKEGIWFSLDDDRPDRPDGDE